MQIIFYKTTSENNRINKVLNNQKIINGHLQEETNLINPSINISLDNNLIDYNYAYIPALNRYYYINNIDINNKMLKINLHCDVLMSFKNEILNSKALITRSNYGNKYLLDSLAYTSEKPIIQYRKLGTCFQKGAYYVMVKGGQ